MKWVAGPGNRACAAPRNFCRCKLPVAPLGDCGMLKKLRPWRAWIVGAIIFIDCGVDCCRSIYSVGQPTMKRCSIMRKMTHWSRLPEHLRRGLPTATQELREGATMT